MAAHAAVAGHDAGRQALDQLRSRAIRAAEAGAAAGWQHEFLDDVATVTQAFVETPTTPFAVTSARRDPDNGLMGVGLASEANSVLDLFVNYDVQLSSSFTSHTVYAGLAVKF